MDGASIRKQVGTLGPRTRGARLPETLRREIAEYAGRRRSAGMKVSDIARETGVSAESVRRWSSSKQTRVPAFLPVRVRSDATAAHGIVLHTAQGHRVTGLDLDGAVQLLRILG